MASNTSSMLRQRITTHPRGGSPQDKFLYLLLPELLHLDQLPPLLQGPLLPCLFPTLVITKEPPRPRKPFYQSVRRPSQVSLTKKSLSPDPSLQSPGPRCSGGHSAPTDCTVPGQLSPRLTRSQCPASPPWCPRPASPAPPRSRAAPPTAPPAPRMCRRRVTGSTPASRSVSPPSPKRGPTWRRSSPQTLRG